MNITFICVCVLRLYNVTTQTDNHCTYVYRTYIINHFCCHSNATSTIILIVIKIYCKFAWSNVPLWHCNRTSLLNICCLDLIFIDVLSPYSERSCFSRRNYASAEEEKIYSLSVVSLLYLLLTSWNKARFNVLHGKEKFEGAENEINGASALNDDRSSSFHLKPAAVVRQKRRGSVTYNTSDQIPSERALSSIY